MDPNDNIPTDDTTQPMGGVVTPTDDTTPAVSAPAPPMSPVADTPAVTPVAEPATEPADLPTPEPVVPATSPSDKQTPVASSGLGSSTDTTGEEDTEPSGGTSDVV